MTQSSALTKKLKKKVKAVQKARKERMDSYEVDELLRHSKAHDALDAMAENKGNKDVMSLLNGDEDVPVGVL